MSCSIPTATSSAGGFGASLAGSFRESPSREKYHQRRRAATSSHRPSLVLSVRPTRNTLRRRHRGHRTDHVPHGFEHVRPWIFETSQVQGIGAWLVALSAADLLMTFVLLRKSPAYFEANPIAQWFFAKWNITGMVFFKFSMIAGVILLSEIIERNRPGWGRFVLWVGCIGAAYAVFTGGRLYMSPDIPMTVEVD